MGLLEEISAGRKTVVSDGYDMSVGEIVNLYKNQELIINPAFQRTFRWDIGQKSRFLESLLLGIPIPPIFVFQNSQGVWELIDGLQRLSTVIEFMGLLKEDDGTLRLPTELEGTKFLPSLSGKNWDGNEDVAIGLPQQLAIKRTRLRVEILKNESDEHAKYELFQRLNTGGSFLSPQEVRNCIAVMLNKDFFDWLRMNSEKASFQDLLQLTSNAIDRQDHVELFLKYLAVRAYPYNPALDVHEYLEDSLVRLATSKTFNTKYEQELFDHVVSLLSKALGKNVFRRWDGNKFTGQFLTSLFEAVMIGISRHYEGITAKSDAIDFVKSKIVGLWNEDWFRQNSGAGVRGTTRLASLVTKSIDYFKP